MVATATHPYAETREASIRDYWMLLKPGVMSLVVFTAWVGLYAAPISCSFSQGVLIVLAIALGSGGGAAINMWYDADIDRIMNRTQKRPIPSGVISEQDVLALGLILSALSVMLLGLSANWAAAGLLAFAIWFYAVFYTMLLKRSTPQNIVIGGAAGAFPPLIGWLSVHPVIQLEPILYVLIIFMWTPPHFWALALYRHDDYKNASIPMLPAVKGERSTLNHILFYTIVLVFVTLLPYLLGYRSEFYGVGAMVLGGIFFVKAWNLWRTPNKRSSMRLFGFSILYLFALFGMIVCDVHLIQYFL
ncbi:MAG: protoheme IX farnesyltransferase [Alphaproteobacteria bacterium]|nr:MAG: protoheme IX farnesyltransferase [Alphaproteobacteria bacterium]TAF13566.1 MAG: protoheme IX farnesyltransferase [Alphaproteobacteria bacterium]TAF75461.1 MAG: protoheme IX farnesyltransferase [Alphaproteobacteria bacterium]